MSQALRDKQKYTNMSDDEGGRDGGYVKISLHLIALSLISVLT